MKKKHIISPCCVTSKVKLICDKNIHIAYVFIYDYDINIYTHMELWRRLLVIAYCFYSLVAVYFIRNL